MGVEKEVDQKATEQLSRLSRGRLSPLLDGAENMGLSSFGCAPGIAATAAHLPSLTPIWRSAEFQEREIFDLYGIHFDGHPDLRRILMWDEFNDHPMRKDYREPDDYEYEPTPHDDVLERAKQHYAPRPQLDGAEKITATD